MLVHTAAHVKKILTSDQFNHGGFKICDTDYCDPSHKDVSSVLEFHANRHSKKEQQHNVIITLSIQQHLMLTLDILTIVTR